MSSEMLLSSPPHSDLKAYRLRIVGGDAEAVPIDFRAWTVAGADEPFDVIVVVGPADNDSLFTLCDEAEQPYAPIIDLTGNHGLRADYWSDQATSAALADGLKAVAPILERASRLPALPVGGDRIGLWVLGLIYTRHSGLQARVNPLVKDSVDYELISGLGCSRGLLESLHDAGFLFRKFYDKTHVCDVCGSARLLVREICPSCGTSDLDQVSLVHHYSCGHNAPEHTYLHRGDGLLQCPKCNKRLRHLGVDYNRPGKVFECKVCHDVSAEPPVSFKCLDCHGETPAERAQSVSWYHYDLTAAGERALLEGSYSGMSLEDVVMGLMQGHSPKRFVLLFSGLHRISARYGRELSVAFLQFHGIRNGGHGLDADGLQATYGSLMALMMELLRETDLLTQVSETDLLIALPETPVSAIARFEERLREGLAERLPVVPAFEMQIAEGEEAARLVERVLGND